jgi:hypothetical protein
MERDADGGGGMESRACFEAGLRTLQRVSRPGRPTRLEACLFLSEVLSLADRLTAADRRIIPAFLEFGGASAAARALKPGRRGMRVHIQRRLKHYDELVRSLAEGDSLLGTLARLLRENAQEEGRPPRLVTPRSRV